MSHSFDRNLYVLGGAVGALILREAFSYWKNNRTETETVDTSSKPLSASLIGSEHPFALLKDKYGDCVYMDYNATTPIWPEVTEAMAVSESHTSVADFVVWILNSHLLSLTISITATFSHSYIDVFGAAFYFHLLWKPLFPSRLRSAMQSCGE
jgi:hypothetical protein